MGPFEKGRGLADLLWVDGVGIVPTKAAQKWGERWPCVEIVVVFLAEGVQARMKVGRGNSCL